MLFDRLNSSLHKHRKRSNAILPVPSALRSYFLLHIFSIRWYVRDVRDL